jgi:two-component system, NtrC family, sensor kinase
VECFVDAFVWDERFITGLDTVDSQHRHLVDMVNRLGSLRIQGAAGEAEMAQMFGDLAEYAVYHFGEEERLMAEAGIDSRHAGAHAHNHREFVQQVTTMWENRAATADPQAMLFDFLAAWLAVHILGEDRAMARNIARIRQGTSAAAAHDAEIAARDPGLSTMLDALHNLYGVLSAQNRDLAAAMGGLEVKVAERTRELAESNARLTAEHEDLVRAMRHIEQAQIELVRSEKMASLGRMVAGFAHEINTPIGIAVGAVSHEEETLVRINQMLSQDEVREEDLRAQLDTIAEGSRLALSNLRRCAELVHRFKRSSVDQVSEHRRVFDMAELIEDVRFTLHSQLKRLPLSVIVDCPGDIHINGIPGHLEQILTNLILNSVLHGFKNCERAGTIRITARHGADERVRLTVEDDGAGMSPDIIDKVFEPFTTTARGSGGTGLGLFMIYNIVTSELGGSIICTSSPGNGCRFEIEFPAVEGKVQ